MLTRPARFLNKAAAPFPLCRPGRSVAACPGPEPYRIHTSVSVGFVLHAPVRRPGLRAGAQPWFSRQPQAVRPALHRLRRHPEPWMDPRLREGDESGRSAAWPGQRAHRAHFKTRCVHPVGPEPGESRDPSPDRYAVPSSGSKKPSPFIGTNHFTGAPIRRPETGPLHAHGRIVQTSIRCRSRDGRRRSSAATAGQGRCRRRPNPWRV